MLSSLIRLIPHAHRGALYAYCVLSVVSVAIRAASCLLLVPLLGALFGTVPADALPWLGVLTAVTVGGWMVDTALARLGYSIGFALLNDSQHQVADRLTHIPSAGSRLSAPPWHDRRSRPAGPSWSDSSPTC